VYHFESATRESNNENEIHNRKLYRSRWGDRTPSDELNHYVADELLKIEYSPLYPIQFAISPMLGTISGRDQQADRIIEARTRQVFGLLKDNIRLNVRVQEAEHRGQLFRLGDNTRAVKAAPAAIEEPRVVHHGAIQWLSNHATGCVISIILPVKNGAEKLRDLLPALSAQQTRDHIEIVAVDSGSTDESVELLKAANATVISIDPRSFNHGLTRNLATTYAGGNIFVFLNQSTLPADEHWLANLTRPFKQDPTLAGVYGRVLPRPDADRLTARETKANVNASTERIIAKITDWSLYRSMPAHVLRGFVNFHTMSAAIRADVFRAIPFRETDFAEDLIWGKEALEAGLRIQFEPSSVAFHSHNYSVLDILRRNFDDGMACRKIVGLTMNDEQVESHMREIRDTWRYLENECRLTGEELDGWRINAAIRRAAVVFGQWLGLNFDRVDGDLAALLSITEQIKAGAKTEVNGERRAHARFAG
jgi:rhamnosyltransferase